MAAPIGHDQSNTQDSDYGESPSLNEIEHAMQEAAPQPLLKIISSMPSSINCGPLVRPKSSGDPQDVFTYRPFQRQSINPTQSASSLSRNLQLLDGKKSSDIQTRGTEDDTSESVSPLDPDKQASSVQQDNKSAGCSLDTQSVSVTPTAKRNQSLADSYNQGATSRATPETPLGFGAQLPTPEPTQKRKLRQAEAIPKRTESAEHRMVEAQQTELQGSQASPESKNRGFRGRDKYSDSATQITQRHGAAESVDPQTPTSSRSHNLKANTAENHGTVREEPCMASNTTREASVEDLLQGHMEPDGEIRDDKDSPKSPAASYDQTDKSVSLDGAANTIVERTDPVQGNDNRPAYRSILPVRSGTIIPTKARPKTTHEKDDNKQASNGQRIDAPRKVIKWTSMDVVKMLGHKLNQEQRTIEEAKVRCHEQENRIAHLARDADSLARALEASEAEKTQVQKTFQQSELQLKEKSQKIQELEKVVSNLGSEMVQAQSRHKDLKATCEQLTEQFDRLRRDGESFQAAHKDQLEKAIDRANKLQHDYTEVNLELVEVRQSTQHLARLQQELNTMAGALAEEKDRSTALEQRIQTLSEQKVLLEQLTSTDSDMLQKLDNIFEKLMCNTSQLEKISALDQSITSVHNLARNNLATKVEIDSLENVFNSFSESISDHFASIIEAQSHAEPLERMKLWLSECFSGLKDHVSTAAALQSRIEGLTKSEAMLMERCSSYETTISKLREECEEIQNSKSYLQIKISALEKDLILAQQSAVRESQLVGQLQAKESELSQLSSRLHDLEGSLEKDLEHKRLQDDEFQNQKKLSNELETKLRSAQNDITELHKVEAMQARQALIRETELRRELQALSNTREEDLKADHEKKCQEDNLIHLKIVHELEERLSQAGETATKLRDSDEQLKKRTQELKETQIQLEKQTEATHQLQTQLEISKTETAELQWHQSNIKAEIVELQQQLSEAQSKTRNQHFHVIPMKNQSTQATIDSSSMENSQLPEKCTSAENGNENGVGGNPDVVQGGECLGLHLESTLAAPESFITASEQSGTEASQQAQTSQLSEPFSTREDNLWGTTGRSQRRKIDRNIPVEAKATPLGLLDQKHNSQTFERQRDHIITQSPDLFRYINVEAVSQLESHERSIVPETQLSIDKPCSTFYGSIETQEFSTLLLERKVVDQSRDCKVRTPVSRDAVATTTRSVHPMNRNTPNSSSKMYPNGKHTQPNAHLYQSKAVVISESNPEYQIQKDDQRAQPAVRFANDDNCGDSSSLPSSPTLVHLSREHPQALKQTSGKQAKSVGLSRFPGLVPNNNSDVPGNKLKRRRAESEENLPNGSPNFNTSRQDAQQMTSQDQETPSKRGKRHIANQTPLDDSKSQSQAQSRARTSKRTIENTQTISTQTARANRNSNKHDRYDLRFKEVLGMQPSTQSSAKSQQP